MIPADEPDPQVIDRCASELFDWLQVAMTRSGVRPIVAASFDAASDDVKLDLRGIVCVVLGTARTL